MKGSAAALNRSGSPKRPRRPGPGAHGAGLPPCPVQALRQRVRAWAVRLRVDPRVVRIQPMRRKWGSCSLAGTVTLALDLLDQDGAFQDFVIVHELLHLRLPSHGRLFKALLGAHVPEWRALERRANDSIRP